MTTRNAGKGGVARRATLVKRIRKENPNTLLVDAGDVMQGTPYFNYYKGEVEYKAMSAIGYDAGTMGNHEFDNGVDALAAAMKFANFDLVSSNYDVKGTALEPFVKQYVVKTVGGIRVGLFGLGISPAALITPDNFKGVTFNDPMIVARNTVKILRDEQRCNLIVCMSHLGYYETPDATLSVIRKSPLRSMALILSRWSHAHVHERTGEAEATLRRGDSDLPGWQEWHQPRPGGLHISRREKDGCDGTFVGFERVG